MPHGRKIVRSECRCHGRCRPAAANIDSESECQVPKLPSVIFEVLFILVEGRNS